MTMFYGYKRLTKPEDWEGLAGKDKWVPGRSAFELAHAWHPASGLPRSISSALDQSGVDSLKGIRLNLCLVEKPVFLDSHHGPSMTDLMAYGHNSRDEVVVIAVEGKADEVFGSRVAAWIRGEGKNSELSARPTRLRRLQFLSKHLGTDIRADSNLRYQLLHRTVSAILESQLHGASAAVVIVHAFGPESSDNRSDFMDFLNTLGGNPICKDEVCGPIKLGENKDLPVYFLWCHQTSTIQAVQTDYQD